MIRRLLRGLAAPMFAVTTIAGASFAGASFAGADSTGADSAAVEGRPIRSIRVHPRDVFEPVPESRLSPLFRLANRVHVTTRSSTIRRQLLFREGEPFEERRRAESERLLRRLDFVQPVTFSAVRLGDSVDVELVTQDAWTTQLQFNLERGGGRTFGSFGVTERNLAGFGKSVDAFYDERPNGITRSLGFGDPALFGTRIRLHLGSGRGTAGSYDDVRVGQPFYSEEARHSFGLQWRHGASTGSLYRAGSEVATFDQRTSDTEIWAGLGERTDGTVRRVVLSFLWRERALGPSQLSAPVPPEFEGGEELLRIRRAAVDFRWWRPNFIQRDGAERMDRIEDWDIGPQVALQVGSAPAFMGSSAGEGWFRIEGSIGAENAAGFGIASGRVSSRWRHEPQELLRLVNARWYVQWSGSHTLVLAVFAAEGSRVARDFQLVSGGLSGLRAYPVQAIAGHELVRANLEHRWRPHWQLGGLVRVGTAVFYDVAHGWGPGADPTNWFNAAGVGLRLVPPRSALGPVFRMDLAWPVSPTRDGQREVVLSFGSSQAF